MIREKKKSINSKFIEAFEETKNFHELLSKFSTNRKKLKSDIDKDNTMQEYSILYFDDGWEYLGSIIEDKFDGFGCLSNCGKEVYHGYFEMGKMHGRGKLHPHTSFKHLISDYESWEYFEGEFQEGRV